MGWSGAAMLGPTQGSEVVTGLQGVPSTRAGSIQPWGKGSRDSSAVSGCFPFLSTTAGSLCTSVLLALWL